MHPYSLGHKLKYLVKLQLLKMAEVSKLTTTYKIIKAFSLSKSIHPAIIKTYMGSIVWILFFTHGPGR